MDLSRHYLVILTEREHNDRSAQISEMIQLFSLFLVHFDLEMRKSDRPVNIRISERHPGQNQRINH